MGAAHSVEGARLAILDALNSNLGYQEMNPFMAQVSLIWKGKGAMEGEGEGERNGLENFHIWFIIIFIIAIVIITSR